MTGHQESLKSVSAQNVNQHGGIKRKCKNGGCTREIYRGIFCFRCWAGVKWTSIKQRVENKNGNNPSYENMPIGFTKKELIEWVLKNPPPKELITPSIDRIESKLGYIKENIQWLERNKNSAGHRKNVPDGFRICPICNKKLKAHPNYFGVNNGKKYGAKLQTYCKKCKKEYDRKWRLLKNGYK